MIELALTRIFSVTMYYHFAFLAISIALFGLSASGVYVYVMRRSVRHALDRQPADSCTHCSSPPPPCWRSPRSCASASG